MPVQIFGAEAAVTYLNRAFNDLSPSNAVFKNQVTNAGTTDASVNAFANTFAGSFATLSDDALATRVMTNMGLMPNAELQAALRDYFTANGAANRGTVVLQLSNILAGLENASGSLAVYAAAASAWNNETTSAYTYSSNPASTTSSGDSGTTNTGQTFVLTNSNNPNTGGVDLVNGTAGNDNIVGVLNAAGTGDSNSYDAGDVLNGGDGTDKLSVTLVNAATALVDRSSPVASSVETLSLSNSSSSIGGDQTDGNGTANSGWTNALNVSTLSGLNKVMLASSLNNTYTQVKGLASIVDIEQGGQGRLTLTYNAAAVAGSADVQKLLLTGTSAGDNKTNSFVADGIETVAITSDVSSALRDVTGSTLTKITGDGKGDLSVRTSSSTVKTIDLSASTGKDSVTTTSNATSISSIKTGSGDDTISLGIALKKAIAIDGGTGTNTLEAAANTTFDSDAFASVTNIQKILLAADNVVVNLDQVSGLKEVATAITNTTAGTKSGNVDVQNLANASTVTMSAKNLKAANSTDPATFDLDGQAKVTATVKNASTGTSDSIKLNIVNDNASKIKSTAEAVAAGRNAYVIDEVNVQDVEAVAIDSSGTFGRSNVTLLDTDATSFVLTGSNELRIGGSAVAAGGIKAAAGSNVTFDASAMTGRLGVTLDAGQQAVFETGMVGGQAANDLLTIKLGNGEDVSLAATKFEITTAVFALNAGNSAFSFTGLTDATAKTVVFNSAAAGTGDVATVTGLKAGDSLSVQATSNTNANPDKLAVQGAGSSSALTLAINGDDIAGVASDVKLSGLDVSRVGTLTINNTRVDGAADAGTDVKQATTELTGGLKDTSATASLKTINVIGSGTGAEGNKINLGQLDGDKITTLDMSQFAGEVTKVLLDAAGSEGTRVILNSKSEVKALTLGSGSDTVVIGQNFAENITITGLTKGAGATLATKVDVIDLSANALAQGKYTIANNGTDVDISVTGGNGKIIKLIGVQVADLTDANFIFGG